MIDLQAWFGPIDHRSVKRNFLSLDIFPHTCKQGRKKFPPLFPEKEKEKKFTSLFLSFSSFLLAMSRNSSKYWETWQACKATWQLAKIRGWQIGRACQCMRRRNIEKEEGRKKGKQSEERMLVFFPNATNDSDTFEGGHKHITKKYSLFGRFSGARVPKSFGERIMIDLELCNLRKFYYTHYINWVSQPNGWITFSFWYAVTAINSVSLKT